MRTQKPLDSVGWLGGANNRLVVHEGAKAMNDLDSDVDAEQMTHSDEPTTEKGREQHLRDLASLDAEQGGLSTINRDFTRRLIKDVDWLEAEVERLREAAKRAYDDKCYCDSHHGGDEWKCAHMIIEEALIQDGYIVTVAEPYEHHHVGERPCTICKKGAAP